MQEHIFKRWLFLWFHSVFISFMKQPWPYNSLLHPESFYDIVNHKTMLRKVSVYFPACRIHFRNAGSLLCQACRVVSGRTVCIYQDVRTDRAEISFLMPLYLVLAENAGPNPRSVCQFSESCCLKLSVQQAAENVSFRHRKTPGTAEIQARLLR